MIVGPNIPSQDGIVLAFEGASTRSFKGEPTTNLSSLRSTEKRGGNEYLLYENLAPIFDANGLGTYTFSFELKSDIPGNISVYYADRQTTSIRYKWTPTATINATTSFKRYEMTVLVEDLTIGQAHCSLAFYGTYGTGRIPTVRNVQVEKKAYSTPFVDGARGNDISTGGGWSDLSRNGNNGQLINGPSFINEYYGGLSFDGTNSYVNIPFNSNTMDFSLGQTICMWLKPATGANSARRNPYNQAYGGSGTITHEPSGIFNYFFGTNGGNSTPYVGVGSGFTVLPNELAFIAVTRSQPLNICRWFKNGVRYTNTSAGGYASTNNGTSPILIGAGYTSRFLGNIYSLIVYNKYLTDEEILKVYNSHYSRFF